MRLSEILQGTSPSYLCGDKNIRISSLAMDSRKVSSEALFIALPGSHTDGNRYIKEAIEKGAVAILSELQPPPAPIALTRWQDPEKPIAWIQVENVFSAMGKVASNFYKDPSADMAIIGVTGTNGKTTVTYFLESILGRAGAVPGVLGTINYRVRGRILEKAVNTTPYSLELIRLLAQMQKRGATHVAMEVSSHALATYRVEDVHFDVSVLTNIQSDHLDFHKTPEEYFAAKARLFELLGRTGSPKKKRTAVLNLDDPSASRLRHCAQGAQVLTYGFTQNADFMASGVGLTPQATIFRLRHQGWDHVVRLKLIGQHNVYNALAAAAAATSLGLEPKAILEGLSNLAKVPGRLEPVEAGQAFSVFVDYAHTPSALASILACLKLLPHRKIITVFGCGGDRDRTKRGPMGVAACAASDLALVTSDNPRSENPNAILSDIEQGLQHARHENYKIIPDRQEAIYEAIRLAQAKDIVLIAGKGHEDYQILGERTIRFDDREMALKALKDCGKS